MPKRYYTILFSLLLAVFFISAKTDKKQTGKELFEEHCSSCHHENQTATGPPFQKIRESYGLDWSLRYIRNAMKIVAAKDTVAEFNFNVWGLPKPAYPQLSDSQIIRILDYVDGFSVYEELLKHRKISMKNKAIFNSRVDSAHREYQLYTDWHQFLDE